MNLAEVVAVAVENLDAGIASVRHIDISLCIGRNAVRRVELSGPVAGFPKGLEPSAVYVYLGHAGIDVAVADKGVAGRIPRHIGYLPEHSVHWRQRRLGMLQRLSSFVRGFLLAPENHGDLACRVELDHHVRALVDGPHVFRLGYPHRVRERPRVHSVTDLTHEL